MDETLTPPSGTECAGQVVTQPDEDGLTVEADLHWAESSRRWIAAVIAFVIAEKHDPKSNQQMQR